ncbi:MAG: hypothetical protein AB1589_01695 [Cyanobacteriota bacterium]
MPAKPAPTDQLLQMPVTGNGTLVKEIWGERSLSPQQEFRTRQLQLGTRNLEFRTRQLQLGTRNLEFRTRHLQLGTRNLEFRTRKVVGVSDRFFEFAIALDTQHTIYRIPNSAVKL